MSNTTTPEKEALRRAVKVVGSQAELAKECGLPDRRVVWAWSQEDRQVPAEHCPAIERATRALGEPVLCEELRPDVAWGVLRKPLRAKRST